MLLRPALLLSLLTAPLVQGADSALLDLLPPNASFVLGVNVRKMVSAPSVQKAVAEAQAAGPQWTAMLQAIGFDPVRDVDEILLAVTGGGQNPPTLILARGRFGAIRSLAEQHKGKNSLVFLDDGTAIGGDAPAVQAALRRRGSTAASGNALAVRVAAAAERYDIFGLGAIPSTVGMPGTAAEFLKLLDRFQFGMSVSSGVQLAAELEAKTPQAAKGLAELISCSLKPEKGAGEIAKYLNLTTAGRTLRISLTLPEEEVNKMIRAGAGAASARSAFARAAAPQSAPDVAPQPAETSRVPKGAALLITGSESDGGTIVVSKP